MLYDLWYTILSDLLCSGPLFGLLVEDWTCLCLLVPDLGLPDCWGGGLGALPFCGILGNDGVRDAEFLLKN